MNAFATPQPFTAPFRTRSLGLKFFVILVLAFIMSIPGLFMDNLTSGRADLHGIHDVTQENAATPAKLVLGIRLTDSYRSIHRSLHYITLFLALVFLTYFLFEALTGKRVHPAQYAMVGIAQTIFYLLLLSLAEHLGFDWSYLVAGAATVALFAVNTGWVFHSRQLALRSLAVFTALYAFIYVLLRVEAYALLVGAIVSFIAITAAMYITRNVDWYGSGAVPGFDAAMSPVTPGNRDSWLR